MKNNYIILLCGIYIFYLVLSCWNYSENLTENFENSDSVIINMTVNYENYIFVSFNDLNDKYKKIIKEKLEDNKNFVDSETPLNIDNGTYMKTPIFIIKSSDATNIIKSSDDDYKYLILSLSKYANNTFRFKNDNKEYLYHDEDMEMIYYARSGNINNLLLINQDISIPNNFVKINNDINNKFIVPFNEVEDLYVFSSKPLDNSNNSVKINIDKI